MNLFSKYRHKNTECYKLSKEFTDFVSKRLREIFPTIFAHFKRIKELEGFLQNEAYIGTSLFTSFTITCDYNCKPHLDKDNYNLGFILWVQEDICFNLFSIVVVKLFSKII